MLVIGGTPGPDTFLMRPGSVALVNQFVTLPVEDENGNTLSGAYQV
jgi:hypothetical protein